jgi:hypothetical protein
MATANRFSEVVGMNADGKRGSVIPLDQFDSCPIRVVNK